MAVKIDIVAGFPGAGKTTFVKKIIKEQLHRERLAVIQNEFGDISIDAAILKCPGIDIKGVAVGGACCSPYGNLSSALKEALAKNAPDRVIIETSGIDRLSAVLEACRQIARKMDGGINICATVVDAVKYKMYSDGFGELYKEQIINAKTIVLSRTQFVDQHRLADLVRDIRSKNLRADIVTTPWNRFLGRQMVTTAEGAAEGLAQSRIRLKIKCYNPDLNERQAIAHQNYDSGCSCNTLPEVQFQPVFESWGVETPRNFSRADIENILRLVANDNYGRILRAKGILPAKRESWLHFDYVPGEMEVGPIAPDNTGRISVMGERLDTSRLSRLFNVQ
ncbi:putative GTP-binding protein YjiA [Ruminiclostridium hungatei]|uniref:Putative GTP-binding protein YjiA n=1 Tax=Ruminiclostridium hungatei TaxID=48256 RepID=A0A1V4SIY6_RUMHU|nr:GTP-binding protein [Ruminiclostridium hungatei]OPX43849.1 putative GTP-binding protein YjiA [Ruminiclostridium hungatei]